MSFVNFKIEKVHLHQANMNTIIQKNIFITTTGALVFYFSFKLIWCQTNSLLVLCQEKVQVKYECYITISLQNESAYIFI